MYDTLRPLWRDIYAVGDFSDNESYCNIIIYMISATCTPTQIMWPAGCNGYVHPQKAHPFTI